MNILYTRSAATNTGPIIGTDHMGGCAYHGNETGHGEQSEVEGTHASVVLECRIVESCKQMRE